MNCYTCKLLSCSCLDPKGCNKPIQLTLFSQKCYIDNSERTQKVKKNG